MICINEIWLDIKNYEGYYQVSNMGNIRSLDRYVNNNGSLVLVKGKIKKPYITKLGYLQVNLCKNGGYRKFYVHRLVYFTFNPEYDLYDYSKEINHINGDKTKNELRNLELVTHSENLKHAVKNKLLIMPQFKK